MESKWRPLEMGLLAMIGEGLARHGFARHQSRDRFIRPRDFGYDGVALSFTGYADGSCNVVHAGLRHEELQRLLAPFQVRVPRALERSMWTMSQVLNSAMVAGPRFWSLRSGADIEPVASAILSAVADVALPFFEGYSSLVAVLDALEDGTGSRYAGLSLPAAETALAAAYLLGRREQFEDTAVRRAKALASNTREKPDVSEFVEMAEVLRACWGDPEEAIRQQRARRRSER